MFGLSDFHLLANPVVSYIEEKYERAAAVLSDDWEGYGGQNLGSTFH